MSTARTAPTVSTAWTNSTAPTTQDFLAAAAPIPSVKYTLSSSSRVLKATFSPDSKLIASGSFDKKVRIYSVEGGSAANLQYTLDDAMNRVSSVAFSPDSKLFVSGSEDNEVRLYDLNSAGHHPLKKWPLQCTLNDATGGVLSAAFSPDSRLLASGSEDSKVRVYGHEEQTAPSPQHIFDDKTVEGDGMTNSSHYHRRRNACDYSSCRKTSGYSESSQRTGT